MKNTTRKTRKTAAEKNAPVEKPAKKAAGTTASKKAGHDPCVKQYMVFGAEPGQEKATACEFILATCGAKARETFRPRHPGVEIWQVMQTAESVLTKSFIESHDQFSKGFQTAADEFRKKAYAELARKAAEAPKLVLDASDENLAEDPV